jgi:hypothetical protein
MRSSFRFLLGPSHTDIAQFGMSLAHLALYGKPAACQVGIADPPVFFELPQALFKDADTLQDSFIVGGHCHVLSSRFNQWARPTQG